MPIGSICAKLIENRFGGASEQNTRIYLVQGVSSNRFLMLDYRCKSYCILYLAMNCDDDDGANDLV